MTQLQVVNLDRDLCSGVILVELIKSVYGSKAGNPTYNQTPRIRVQYLDNAVIVCGLLEKVGHPHHFLKPERKGEMNEDDVVM